MTESASPPRSQPGARLPLVVALIALAGGGWVWFSLSRDMAELRQGQTRLAEQIDDLRGVPTLDVAGAPARGSDEAVVTLVEFSDYQCPFCVKYTREILPDVDRAYVATGRVRYVFRDFPIDQLHPQAIKAHEAGQCAAEQGRFWDIHFRLFGAAGAHTDTRLEATAAEAGVDLAAWRACLESGRARDAIERSVADATRLGATGTPTFFIGVRDRATDKVRLVRAVTGAQPFEVFQQALDLVLSQVN